MSEFKIIESQEQFDAMVKDRIARAKDSVREEFSDYDTLKTQNAELSKQIAQLTEQLKTQTATIDTNKTDLDALNAKISAYESASVKTRIALELGLPYQMAERLTGNDETEIRADAENMLKLIGTRQPVAPLGSSEPTATGDPTESAFKKLAAQINPND